MADVGFSPACTLRESRAVAIIGGFHALPVPDLLRRAPGISATIRSKQIISAARESRVSKRGQVAQVVERSPEKAGVGGSTPSLATMFSITYPLAFPHLGPLWVQFNSFTARVSIGC